MRSNKEIKLARRQKHLEELQALGYCRGTLKSLTLCENRAHFLSEQACNGEITDKVFDREILAVTKLLTKLFGGALPDNFFVNGDPRGYALKLDQGVNYHPLSYTDMGGYGILAPEDL